MADLAIGKKVSAGVMEYATDLKEDHKEHLSDLTAAATTANVKAASSPMVDTLKKKGMEAHHKLMGMEGKDFENAFLDEMIKGHTDVLDKLDNKVLKSELSAPIKGEIDDLRKGVQEHLAKAKTLRMG